MKNKVETDVSGRLLCFYHSSAAWGTFEDNTGTYYEDFVKSLAPDESGNVKFKKSELAHFFLACMNSYEQKFGEKNVYDIYYAYDVIDDLRESGKMYDVLAKLFERSEEDEPTEEVEEKSAKK